MLMVCVALPEGVAPAVDVAVPVLLPLGQAEILGVCVGLPVAVAWPLPELMALSVAKGVRLAVGDAMPVPEAPSPAPPIVGVSDVVCEVLGLAVTVAVPLSVAALGVALTVAERVGTTTVPVGLAVEVTVALVLGVVVPVACAVKVAEGQELMLPRPSLSTPLPPALYDCVTLGEGVALALALAVPGMSVGVRGVLGVALELGVAVKVYTPVALPVVEPLAVPLRSDVELEDAEAGGVAVSLRTIVRERVGDRLVLMDREEVVQRETVTLPLAPPPPGVLKEGEGVLVAEAVGVANSAVGVMDRVALGVPLDAALALALALRDSVGLDEPVAPVVPVELTLAEEVPLGKDALALEVGVNVPLALAQAVAALDAELLGEPVELGLGVLLPLWSLPAVGVMLGLPVPLAEPVLGGVRVTREEAVAAGAVAVSVIAPATVVLTVADTLLLAGALAVPLPVPGGDALLVRLGEPVAVEKPDAEGEREALVLVLSLPLPVKVAQEVVLAVGVPVPTLPLAVLLGEPVAVLEMALLPLVLAEAVLVTVIVNTALVVTLRLPPGIPGLPVYVGYTEWEVVERAEALAVTARALAVPGPLEVLTVAVAEKLPVVQGEGVRVELAEAEAVPLSVARDGVAVEVTVREGEAEGLALARGVEDWLLLLLPVLLTLGQGEALPLPPHCVADGVKEAAREAVGLTLRVAWGAVGEPVAERAADPERVSVPVALALGVSVRTALPLNTPLRESVTVELALEETWGEGVAQLVGLGLSEDATLVLDVGDAMGEALSLAEGVEVPLTEVEAVLHSVTEGEGLREGLEVALLHAERDAVREMEGLGVRVGG